MATKKVDFFFFSVRGHQMANNSKSVLEEVEDFEKVVEAPSASVHGVLTSISPVKKGRKRNYFEGAQCPTVPTNFD